MPEIPPPTIQEAINSAQVGENRELWKDNHKLWQVHEQQRQALEALVNKTSGIRTIIEAVGFLIGIGIAVVYFWNTKADKKDYEDMRRREELQEIRNSARDATQANDHESIRWIQDTLLETVHSKGFKVEVQPTPTPHAMFVEPSPTPKVK